MQWWDSSHLNNQATDKLLRAYARGFSLIQAALVRNLLFLGIRYIDVRYCHLSLPSRQNNYPTKYRPCPKTPYSKTQTSAARIRLNELYHTPHAHLGRNRYLKGKSFASVIRSMRYRRRSALCGNGISTGSPRSMRFVPHRILRFV